MAKKKKFSFGEVLLGNIGASLILWIFILIVFALLDTNITDVFNIVDGDNEGATTFYNFMILYVVTVALLTFGSFKMFGKK